MTSRPLAIVPARTGSRGIPRKNYTPLGGLPPLVRAVMVADRAGCNIVVSADCPRPKGWVGQAQWLEAYDPLHTETCSMLDVVRDVLARVPGPEDQIVLLVQPTQPLREPQHLEQALVTLRHSPHAGCVFSVVETEPAEKLLYAEQGVMVPATGTLIERRQDARPTYKRDGTVYAWRRALALYAQPWVGFEIPRTETCALDTPDDWAYAEWRLTRCP